MKRNLTIVGLALAVAVAPSIARPSDLHADMIMEHCAQIMPFDQSQATHMFLPSTTGGVVEVVVHDMSQAQISLVRSHLLDEAARFARGDYSDPAYIHGKTMPGLSELTSGAAKVSVRYFETPTGAAITFNTGDSRLVSAIHDWLAAQQRDHGSQMNHCDMKM